MQGVTSTEAGLCANCAHAKTVVSDRGSVFLRCLLAETDPRFAKYPRLPVLECAGFQRSPTEPRP
jgi:hypothetical protein